MTDSFLLFSLVEKAKLCYIHFNKKPNLDFKKLEKMSGLEPKVLILVYTAISIIVVGSKHKARRQDRKVMRDFFLNKFMKTSYASSVQ